YAPQQMLGPESFPSLFSQYKKLDTNGDDRLDVDELAVLLTTNPHVVLSIDFPAETGGDTGKVKLAITEHIPEVEVLAQPAADRAILILGTTRLIIMATDLAKALPPAQSFAANGVRLMVHDQCDALCELLDADADGRLGEREISTAAATLLKYDSNHDGKLQSAELPYTMLVAFQRGERPDDNSFYRPRSNGARSAIAAAPAWFIRADFNGDGDVSRREFLGTDAQFLQLDTNHNGFISAAEAAAAK
ncbi:MAG TPA: hypothetical protein VHU84_13615, partial [Lacipirellulaceae bacterium]|nr:hypothetical protein [Lacipirellulaceae bacterium]